MSRLTLAIALPLAAGGAFAAYEVLGWLGVAILGLLTTFVAVRVDLERDGPVGSSYTTSLYADTAMAVGRMGRRDKADHAAGMAATLEGAFLAKILGSLMIVAGGAGFVLLQMPH